MAKKKAGPAKSGTTPNAIVIRGSAEWRAWLKRAAEFQRTSMAEFLDRAATEYARQIGFKEAAPKR